MHDLKRTTKLLFKLLIRPAPPPAPATSAAPAPHLAARPAPVSARSSAPAAAIPAVAAPAAAVAVAAESSVTVRITVAAPATAVAATTPAAAHTSTLVLGSHFLDLNRVLSDDGASLSINQLNSSPTYGLTSLSTPHLLDQLLGRVLPGEGDECECLWLVVLLLVHGSDDLHHLAELLEVSLDLLLGHRLPRRQLANIDLPLPRLGLLTRYFLSLHNNVTCEPSTERIRNNSP